MPEWPNGFPYFLQFKFEFCNNELIIWAIVNSFSCFCWLYRAFPSLDAKNIINLILILTVWWCPYVVISCAVGRGCLLWPACSPGKTLLAFAMLHFYSKTKPTCYSRYLFTSYFCIPVTTNKASGGDGIPTELLQVLKDDAVKVLHSICPPNLEKSAVATGLEKVRFHSNPKEGQCQRMFKLLHNGTYFTC